MADSPPAHRSQDSKPTIRRRFAGLRTSLIISAVLPLLMYLLASPHLAPLPVFALMAVPPVLYCAYGWVRARRIDPMSIITLVLIAVGMLLALLVRDPRLFLLRDSYESGAFGLLCLLSLPFNRPAALYLYQWFLAQTPQQRARLQAATRVPYARFARRLITAVWGAVFLGETLLDTFLVYHLPIALWMAIHPVLFWGAMVAAFGWAILYARHAQAKIRAGLRQTAKEQEALTREAREEAQTPN
jgi:intracellular septation protein A